MRIVIAALLAALGTSAARCDAQFAPACTCGWCYQIAPRPIAEDYKTASLVVVGRVSNSRKGTAVDGAAIANVVDLDISTVFKTHGILTGAKKITIRAEPNVKGQYVVFCEIYKGRIEAFRALPIAENSELPVYVAGMATRESRPLADRVSSLLRFVNHKEREIAADAFLELSTIEFHELGAAAAKLDPSMLARRIADPETADAQLGVYASLLGHCGNPRDHGAILRRLLENSRPGAALDLRALMLGYVALQPKEAWSYLESSIIAKPDADFRQRYAALRATNVLWDDRAKLVSRVKLVAAMLAMAEQRDVADFAINNLRRWRRWETTERILALAGRDTHRLGIIQSAILRFALQSLAAEAAAYVAAERRRDPEYVSDTEELLKLEFENAPPGDGMK
jgi:hypothetical protein